MRAEVARYRAGLGEQLANAPDLEEVNAAASALEQVLLRFSEPGYFLAQILMSADRDLVTDAEVEAAADWLSASHRVADVLVRQLSGTEREGEAARRARVRAVANDLLHLEDLVDAVAEHR